MKILLCLLMVFWIPAFAFSQTGTIQGTVYNNSTKEPLAGAEVFIVEIDTRQKTDENGKFVFSDISAGTYTLITTVPDTELSQRTSIVVTAEETLEPEIYVETAQYRLEGVEVTGESAPKTVSKKSLQSEKLHACPGQPVMSFARFQRFRASVSPMILVAPSIFAAVPMRITSTISTGYRWVTRITLVDSFHP